MKKKPPAGPSAARKAVLRTALLGKGGAHGKPHKAQRRAQRARPPSSED
ncbi:hypothetical protein [Solimonas aquatica]|nr:hypothetical protein [Solimonas aquatica]